jgi:hypothetical protein
VAIHVALQNKTPPEPSPADLAGKGFNFLMRLQVMVQRALVCESSPTLLTREWSLPAVYSEVHGQRSFLSERLPTHAAHEFPDTFVDCLHVSDEITAPPERHTTNGTLVVTLVGVDFPVSPQIS